MSIEVKDKNVVVTGTFAEQRAELESKLRALGAEVKSGVSSKTDILFAGEKAGSKLAKAEELGIPIYGEAELMALLGGNAPAKAMAETVKAEAAKAAPKGVGKHTDFLKGKTICTTGTLLTMTRAQLKALITASGGKLVSSPSAKTDLMISGLEWGSKLRDAISRKVKVITEGEFLLMLEGRAPGNFPEPSDVPNGEVLAKLPVLETGSLKIDCPHGDLRVDWKKVAFTPHVRFLEMHGFEYEGDVQYLGTFFLNGKELSPAGDGGYGFYGIESWRRAYFWEDGSDFDDHGLQYDGKHGFNITPLIKASAGNSLTPKDWTLSGDQGFQVRGRTVYYGDVCYDESSFWVLLTNNQTGVQVVMHTAPNIIRESQPYG